MINIALTLLIGSIGISLYFTPHRDAFARAFYNFGAVTANYLDPSFLRNKLLYLEAELNIFTEGD